MNTQLFVSSLTVVLVPLVLGWLMRRSARQSADQVGSTLVIRGSTVAMVGIWASIVTFSVAAMATPFLVKSDEWWLELLFLGFVALGAFGLPAVLTVDERGVNSAVWYRKVSLLWAEVVRLEYNAGNRTFVVVGSSGRKLSCTGFHTGAAPFRTEVLRRTGLPLTVLTPGVVRMNSTEVPNHVALKQRD